MHINSVSLMVLSAQPAESAQFYVDHFGFMPTAQLSWFVSLQHPQHVQFNLDLIHKDHAAAGAYLKGRTTSGVMLALIVDDLEAEAERLTQQGMTLLMPPTREPWGQQRLQLLGPDDVVIELLEFVPPDLEWLAGQA